MTSPSSLHTVTLLDRALSPEDRQAATEHVAEEQIAVVPGTESVVIFRIDREWMALSTHVFQGIADGSAVHPIPHRQQGAVLGLTNVRGELLICVGLAAVLGIAARGANPPVTGARLMLVNGSGGRLAFPVDEVYGVHRYRPDELQDISATIANAGTKFTMGILPWQEHLVARLDEDLMFRTIDRALA